MTVMLGERFTVGLTPLPTAARVARQRSALRMRVISAGISLLICVGIAVFYKAFPQHLIVWMFVVWGITTAVWLVISGIGLSRAKKDLNAIGSGDALVIDRDGIEFLHPTPVRATWGEISALKIEGPTFGAGPDLVMEVGGQPVAKVPMSFLDALPAAIDSAAGARSLGRVRVDASAMDRLL